MSATNRGAIRVTHDRYETPSRAILSYFDNNIIEYPALECSCGNGNITKFMNRSLTTSLDIDPLVRPDKTINYLDHNCSGRYKTIITNPPYSHAVEFVNKALDDVMDSGKVIMLLRLNFLESIKRHEWFKSNPPSHIYVLSKRPSFTKGGTDACAYAWFVWTKGDVSNDLKMYWV